MVVFNNNDFRMAFNKGYVMKKKTKKTVVIALLMLASFCTGIGYEKRQHDATFEEITESAREACVAQTAAIKFACRK